MNILGLMKKAALILLVACILAGAYFLFYISSPFSDEEKLRSIDIKRGMTFRQISNLLVEADLLRHPFLFHVLARTKGATRQVRAGEYEFSPAMSPLEILNKLMRGEIKYFMVTLPENITMREIKERLLLLRLIDAEEFKSLTHDGKFIRSLGIEASTLEGFLFPDTYKLDRSMGTEMIIRAMVRRFWQAITPEMVDRARQLNLTLTEVMILASIIGKESSLVAEKPYISSVFHNRLRIGMKLQSDPTAVYNLENFSGRILRRHLRLDTPHNTYLIDGLPPTPIGNPGLDSIMATLHPAPSKYLFFVARDSISHHFSETYREHRNAIIKYQINR